VPVLDPAVVAGKIVVCERGVTARVNKSLAVQEAGGVGMILVNPTNNSLNADFHTVPRPARRRRLTPPALTTVRRRRSRPASPRAAR